MPIFWRDQHLREDLPYRLAVRIAGFHPADRGSIPRMGIIFAQTSFSSISVWWHYANKKSIAVQSQAAVAQWIRRLPTEQEIHGSSPCSGMLLCLGTVFVLPVFVFCSASSLRSQWDSPPASSVNSALLISGKLVIIRTTLIMTNYWLILDV